MARLGIQEKNILPRKGLPMDYRYSMELNPLGSSSQNPPPTPKNAVTNNPGKTKTLLFFGDSFSTLFAPYFSSGFGRVIYFSGQPNSKDFAQVVLHEKPDIIIEERVERMMYLLVFTTACMISPKKRKNGCV